MSLPSWAEPASLQNLCLSPDTRYSALVVNHPAGAWGSAGLALTLWTRGDGRPARRGVGVGPAALASRLSLPAPRPVMQVAP